MLPLIWGLLSKPPYVGLNKTTCADFLRMAVFGRFRCRCRCNSRRLWCNSKRLWCSSRHPWCSSSRAWCRGTHSHSFSAHRCLLLSSLSDLYLFVSLSFSVQLAFFLSSLSISLYLYHWVSLSLAFSFALLLTYDNMRHISLHETKTTYIFQQIYFNIFKYA